MVTGSQPPQPTGPHGPNGPNGHTGPTVEPSSGATQRRDVTRILVVTVAAVSVVHELAWWLLPAGVAVAVSVVAGVLGAVLGAERAGRRLRLVDQAVTLLESFLGRGAVPALVLEGPAGLAADVIRRADAERARADLVESRAIIDEATGLPNRLGALDRLEQSAAQAERDGVGVFVALVAVDDVANVANAANVADRAGGTAGSTPGNAARARQMAENAMWLASSRTVATLRLADWCSRWSDHELLAVFRTDPSTCWVVAERLRAALTRPAPLPPALGDPAIEVPGLSVSIGVAPLSGDIGLSVRNAELALIEARGRGGNQVRVSTMSFDA